MDGRPHTGAVEAQLARPRDLRLPSQSGSAIHEGLQRLWLDGRRPAQQRRLRGHALEVDPAQPAQDQ